MLREEIPLMRTLTQKGIDSNLTFYCLPSDSLEIPILNLLCSMPLFLQLLECLAIITFVGGNGLEETERSMDILWRVIHPRLGSNVGICFKYTCQFYFYFAYPSLVYYASGNNYVAFDDECSFFLISALNFSPLNLLLQLFHCLGSCSQTFCSINNCCGICLVLSRIYHERFEAKF